MARGESHPVQLAWVPGADDQPAALRGGFDLGDDAVNLVNGGAFLGAPITPLRPINTAQAAVWIGPFVPDRHARFVEVFDVRITAQKPKQFVNQRFQMDLFRGDQRETVAERKT